MMISKDLTSTIFGSHSMVLKKASDIDIFVEHYWDLFKTFTDTFDETVYVVDFKLRCFHFVSNKGIFLCGRSSDEVLRLGYEFYHEVVYHKDFHLIIKIHQVIEDYFSLPNTSIRDLAFIVFDFRRSGYKGRVRLSHKVMPLLIVNNQVQMALCSVSRSASETSGNLFAYYNRKEDFCYKYSFDNELWKPAPLIEISPEEWEILNLTKQGLKDKEIADIIGITHQDLRNTLCSIYRKMNVHSKTQAIMFISNHRINIKSDRHSNRTKYNEKMEGKKQRRPMTPEKYKRIQEALNKGESNNSIAKRENVGEYTIRYHKRTRNLKSDCEHFGN